MPSLIETIRARETAQAEAAQAELASNNVLRQNLMRDSGQLKAVVVHGPNGTTIPALYSEADRAYYPTFE